MPRLRSLVPLAGSLLLLLPTRAPAQAPRHPITIEDFVQMPVVGDPQLSPDGSEVAFTVSTASLETDRTTMQIWLADLASGDTWQATQGDGTDRAPRWAPDGKTLAFLSRRGGSTQIWQMPARGGEPTQLTNLSQSPADFLWSPDGKALYFWADIKWPDSSAAERAAAPYPTEARIWTHLFYRHWNEWR
ncbi:MAG TPA: hypothetical protein VNH46_01095, partial [Gemmatimonadales bacterium]|nr:hypothetical protein [Gemmatimonadales bacterium]